MKHNSLWRPWPESLVAAMTPLAPPTTRRVAHAVPGHSPRAILHRAVRDARSPRWSVLEPARRLEAQAHGDVRLLRAARYRLLATAPPDLNLWQSRALTALNIAINELEAERGTPD